MPETFDAFDYLGYLRERWSFAAKTVGAAVLLTGITCLLMTPLYTATATMVIEPPAGSDPRATTAVSAVYLESLKSYEEFASSDTLFAKAAEKFGLLKGSAIESVKAQVLRVTKPKDSKVLELSVTLPDAKQAQAVAQYLAEETVTLNLRIGQSIEAQSHSELEKQLGFARADLEAALAEQSVAEASGSSSNIEAEIRNLVELKFRTLEQLISARALLAEQSHQTGPPSPDVASTRARIEALEKEKILLDKDSSTKLAALARLHPRLTGIEGRVQVAQTRIEDLARRATDMAALSGSRADQVRLVDPGVVPQRPSFPRTTLFIVAAFIIGLALSLTYLTLQFGLGRQKGILRDSSLRVARR